MTEPTSLGAYLDDAAGRLQHSAPALNDALAGEAPMLDTPHLLSTLSAAAILAHHPHHPNFPLALTVLQSPTLPAVLARALPPEAISARPLLSPTQSPDDKARTLRDTVELGALRDYVPPPLRDAIDEHVESQADAIMADDDAHIDLHETVSLLVDVAPFDPLDHPVGRLLGFAFSATRGLYSAIPAREAVAAVQKARGSAPSPPTPRPWAPWLDFIEASLAAMGRPTRIPRPSPQLALAADDDEHEPHYFPVPIERGRDEEVHFVLIGTTIHLEWLGAADDPPVGLSIGDEPVTAAPTTRRMPDGVLRVSWPLANESPPSGGVPMSLTFSSGLTHTFRF